MDFLKEDREDELQRFWSSQAETHNFFQDKLQVHWGHEEVVTPEWAKELIVQVTPSSSLDINPVHFSHFAILSHSFELITNALVLLSTFRTFATSTWGQAEQGGCWVQPGGVGPLLFGSHQFHL